MEIPNFTSKRYIHKDIKQALEVLELNYRNQSFSIEMMSQQVGMSRFTLFRRFKRHTNLSPCELVIMYRLQKAAQRLREPYQSIGCVAKETGFSSLQYFCISFKTYFGVTPTEFANKHEALKN